MSYSWHMWHVWLWSPLLHPLVLCMQHFNKQPNRCPSPQDKWSVNTPCLPNSINIYIDPSGKPYSVAAPLCFTLPVPLSSLIVSITCFDLALGTSRELLSDRVSAGIPLHSTPNALWDLDSTPVPFVTYSQCTQTDCSGIIKKGKTVDTAGKLAGCHGWLLSLRNFQVSMFI